MDIKINNSVESISRLQSGQMKRSDIKVKNAENGFERSQALDSNLRNTEDVRASLVEKAKGETALSTYPPKETIRKISALLAANMIED